MTEHGYLVDTSVLGRAHQPAVGHRLEELARSGRMWTCRMIDLEVAYGSRARDVTAVIEQRRALPTAPISPAVMDRSLRLAEMLAEASDDRGAKPVDLVIAAAPRLRSSHSSTTTMTTNESQPSLASRLSGWHLPDLLTDDQARIRKVVHFSVPARSS